MAEAKKSDAPKIKQGRSPAYPSINLSEAVKRAEQIRDAGATRAEMPPETFYKIWDIGPMSSAARQTMAALNHFGLVDYVGRGDERKVKLSELALKIVLDRQPESSERVVALAKAALSPAIHADLYEKYKSFLPADVVIQTYLTRDKEYNDEAAKNLIAEYKATLAYAGLAEPSNMLPAEGEEERQEPNSRVGTKGTNEPAIPPAKPPTPPAQKAKGQVMEGERELTSGLLSRDANFRLIVSGPVGAKEIERLIEKLELDKEILAEPDEAKKSNDE